MLAPDGKERKALRRRLLLLLLLLLLPPVLRHDRKRDPTSSLCFLKALLLSEQPTDRPTTKNPRKRRGSENMQLPRRGIRRRSPQICHCGIANDHPMLPICPMEDIRVIEWRIFEFRTVFFLSWPRLLAGKGTKNNIPKSFFFIGGFFLVLGILLPPPPSVFLRITNLENKIGSFFPEIETQRKI